MSRMSLDTAIRLSAEVKGGGNIDRVKRSLQELGKSGQTSTRDLRLLRAATFQYSRANDQTIGGIRNSINAFRGLQEQAVIGSREFRRYGAEVERLEGKLKGLEGAADSAGTSLGQKLAAGLAAAGVTRGMRAITDTAATFEAELRKAAAVGPGSAAESFGVLNDAIQRVASTAAGTPTEVAALATALRRAGFTADDTAASLDGIVKGAEATGVGFEQMGGIVGGVLKTFGLDVSETNRVVDVLVNSANSANQTALDVGEAMSYAASTAKTLGVSVEDTAAFISLLADGMITGSRAGTTFSTGLSRLQRAATDADGAMSELGRGNEQLNRTMQALGAQITDVEGNLKPLDQVLIALKRSLDGLSTGEQAIIANALFGAEAGRGFLAILQRSEQDIRKMFATINDSAGVADETREAMDSLQLSAQRLGGNIENLTNQIGGMINTALKPLVDGLNDLIGASQRLPEPIRQFGAAAAAAGLSVLALVTAINALKASLAIVGGIQAVTAALTAKAGAATAAAGATKALNLALLANPWVAVAAGVVAFGVALTNAATRADRFRRSIREGNTTIAEGRQRLDELNKEIDDLQRRLAQESNGRLLNSLRGRLRRAREEARLLNIELQQADTWQRRGREAGGTPREGEYYQPGVGYFDIRTGRFTRPDDASRGGATAAGGGAGAGGGTTATGGGGRAAGSDAAARAEAQLQDQMQQQLQTAQRLSQETQMRVDALRIIDPLMRSIYEAENEAVRIAQRYADLRSQAKSDAELENLAAAERNELQANALRIAQQVSGDTSGLLSDLERINENLQDRLAFEREYGILIRSGINPELARSLVEIQRIGDATRANLMQRMAVLETSILQLDADSEVRKELEEQVELLKEKYRLTLQIENQAREAASQVSPDQTDADRIEDRIKNLQDEIKELSSLSTIAIRGAEAIGDAFGNAFRSLIDGSKSAREAMADFFKQTAASFLEMAVEIIQKQIQMIILQTILNAIGGAFTGGGTTVPSSVPGTMTVPSPPPLPPLPRARERGGDVSRGKPFLVGEKGPELMVPYQSGTILPTDVTRAIASTAAAPATADTGVPFRSQATLKVPFMRSGTAAGNGASRDPLNNEPIKFESVIINEVEYVTRREAEEIGRRSEQRTFKRMQNNPTVRRAAGIA